MILLTVMFYLLIFILGTVMGSFVGAMTWRMYKHLDWVRGRSECEHCHHRLSAMDLVPIASYLSLGGKCRYCHRRIGRLAIRLELGTGLAFLASALLYPSALAQEWISPAELVLSPDVMTALALGLWLICLTIMVALLVYDLQWRLLPNKLILPLVLVAAVHSAVIHLGIEQVGIWQWLIDIALGMLPITGIYGLLYLVSRGRWIGLGDVKLGVAIGLLVPWWGGVLVLFLANLLGSLASIPGMVRRKITGNSEIAFGPYLVVATYLVVLLGWLVGKFIILV